MLHDEYQKKSIGLELKTNEIYKIGQLFKEDGCLHSKKKIKFKTKIIDKKDPEFTIL